jgi:hypothetical protein
MMEARQAWDRALGDLAGPAGSLPASSYEELHAQVARVLLSRSEIDFASEVLDDVPDERRAESWWGALHQLQVCLEEDREERLVFPPVVPLADRWTLGPHRVYKLDIVDVERWRPGRVVGRDMQVVVLEVAERERVDTETHFSTERIELAALREEWGWSGRPTGLPVGAFVELVEYRDRTKALLSWDRRASSFDAIPGLPKLFPFSDRYIRRAFA